MNGIVYQRSKISQKDVTRGTAHTIILGERFYYLDAINIGTGATDNESMWVGHDNDVIRTTFQTPHRNCNQPSVVDSSHPEKTWFGSVHAAGVHCITADGAVHVITYDVDANAYMCAGARKVSRGLLSDGKTQATTLTPLSSAPVFND
jgi:hypothetical protein